MALLIAVVGIAGVLAFSVSARTREFGVRLAIGSKPSQLLAKVLKEGTTIVATGITAGAVVGGVVVGVSAMSFGISGQMPGVVPIIGAAATLIAAAVIASLIPAARAASVDVVQALRSE
jgi:ABC-type antimicrobial peptide transport system permease subunit